MAIVIWPVTFPAPEVVETLDEPIPIIPETERITEEAIQNLTVDEALQELQEQFNKVSSYIITIAITVVIVSVCLSVCLCLCSNIGAC